MIESTSVWEYLALFLIYFVAISAGLVVLLFVVFFVKEWLSPTPGQGTKGTSTPDDDIQLDTEIDRAATMLAEHRAATKRKEKGNG